MLANITEFGQTPLFTLDGAAAAVGVALVLYPLSAFRAMSRAALEVYEAIRRDGTQRTSLDACRRARSSTASSDYQATRASWTQLFGANRESE